MKGLQEGLNSLQSTRVGLNKKIDEGFTETLKVQQPQLCFAKEEGLRLCLRMRETSSHQERHLRQASMAHALR